MSKFSVGQEVFLFNGQSMEIEPDVVYGVLNVPIPVKGEEPVAGESDFRKQLEAGKFEVREQYQLMHHGIVDAEALFESEGALREAYRKFFLGEA